MLKPPLPMTNTLFTSTRSRPPAIAPDARYAFAEGASSDANSFLEEVNVRACITDAHRSAVCLFKDFAPTLCVCACGNSFDKDDRAREDLVEADGSSARAGRSEEGESAKRRGKVVAILEYGEMLYEGQRKTERDKASAGELTPVRGEGLAGRLV